MNRKSFRITVVSDVHGAVERLGRLIREINSGSYFVFCGDGARDVMRVAGEITVPMLCVRGNNDFGSELAETVAENLCGIRTLVTHGHRLGVRHGTEVLADVACRNGCVLAFYGHTHVFDDRTVGGVRIINAGALCNGSYASVEVADGTVICNRKTV